MLRSKYYQTEQKIKNIVLKHFKNLNIKVVACIKPIFAKEILSITIKKTRFQKILKDFKIHLFIKKSGLLVLALKKNRSDSCI